MGHRTCLTCVGLVFHDRTERGVGRGREIKKKRKEREEEGKEVEERETSPCPTRVGEWAPILL